MHENYVAIITPFYCGQLDFESLYILLDKFYKAGVRKIVAGGTTGEGITLSNKEKKDLFIYIKRHFDFEIVGCYSDLSLTFDKCIYEACDKLMVSPQYFIRPNHYSKLSYIKEIADLWGKDIILYNNPVRFSTNIDEKLYSELYEVDNIIGIKEAGEIIDIKQYARWKWFGGNDDAIDIFRHNKFCGMISATGNICPDLLDVAWKEASVDDSVVHTESCAVHLRQDAQISPMHTADYHNIVGKWKKIAAIVFSSPSPLLIKYYLYRKGIISSYETRFYIKDLELERKFTELDEILDCGIACY